MIIALHWEAGPIPIYIFVSKDKVVVQENPLINESSLKSYNIASYFKGKQLYLWITIQNDLIKLILVAALEQYLQLIELFNLIRMQI